MQSRSWTTGTCRLVKLPLIIMHRGPFSISPSPRFQDSDYRQVTSSPSIQLSPAIPIGSKGSFRRLATKEASVVQFHSAIASPPGPTYSYSTKLPSRLMWRHQKREKSRPRKQSPGVKALYLDPVLGTPIADFLKHKQAR